jgi:hypothetical protein
MNKKLPIKLNKPVKLLHFFATGGSQSSTPAAGGSAPVTRKWAMWDMDLTVYYKPLIDAYQAKNPNVKIELIDLGGADLDVLTIKDIPCYANLVRQNRLDRLTLTSDPPISTQISTAAT